LTKRHLLQRQAEKSAFQPAALLSAVFLPLAFPLAVLLPAALLLAAAQPVFPLLAVRRMLSLPPRRLRAIVPAAFPPAALKKMPPCLRLPAARRRAGPDRSRLRSGRWLLPEGWAAGMSVPVRPTKNRCGDRAAAHAQAAGIIAGIAAGRAEGPAGGLWAAHVPAAANQAGRRDRAAMAGTAAVIGALAGIAAVPVDIAGTADIAAAGTAVFPGGRADTGITGRRVREGRADTRLILADTAGSGRPLADRAEVPAGRAGGRADPEGDPAGRAEGRAAQAGLLHQ